MDRQRWSDRGGQTELVRQRWSNRGGQTEVVRQRWSNRGGQTEVVRQRWSNRGGQTEVFKQRWSNRGGQTEVNRQRWCRNNHPQTPVPSLMKNKREMIGCGNVPTSRKTQGPETQSVDFLPTCWPVGTAADVSS